MVQLAPSLLSANFLRLEEQIRDLSEADWLHLDIMDGRFVPNISFGADIVRQIASVARAPLDVHLMIEEPERHLATFLEAGARCISVHAEVCPHLHRVLDTIRESGAEPSVAINPGTSLEALTWVLPMVKQVLIMSVNPGFGGQSFLPLALGKIRRLAEWRAREGYDFRIQVDGGINRETALDAVRAGADVLVIGSALFRGPASPGEELAYIRRLIDQETGR